MKSIKSLSIFTLFSAGLLVFTPWAIYASPESDLKAFRTYFKKKFPGVPMQEFANGVYAIDRGLREQWMAIEEFPPYEPAVEKGRNAFRQRFANGKSMADCFKNGGIGIKNNYPYYDRSSGQVRTLELDINACRQRHGERPLPYGEGKLAEIAAYMAYTSRGKKINVRVPDNAGAQAAYQKGRGYFYARHGQLNMACAHCHMDYAGAYIRSNLLSPALGHMTHFPVYRAKWRELGTVQRRFAGCLKQVRARPPQYQSPTFRNLEYFLTYMSNGIKLNGPAYRQ